jgi:hypothetical protein
MPRRASVGWPFRHSRRVLLTWYGLKPRGWSSTTKLATYHVMFLCWKVYFDISSPTELSVVRDSSWDLCTVFKFAGLLLRIIYSSVRLDELKFRTADSARWVSSIAKYLKWTTSCLKHARQQIRLWSSLLELGRQARVRLLDQHWEAKAWSQWTFAKLAHPLSFPKTIAELRAG